MCINIAAVSAMATTAATTSDEMHNNSTAVSAMAATAVTTTSSEMHNILTTDTNTAQPKCVRRNSLDVLLLLLNYHYHYYYYHHHYHHHQHHHHQHHHHQGLCSKTLRAVSLIVDVVRLKILS